MQKFIIPSPTENDVLQMHMDSVAITLREMKMYRDANDARQEYEEKEAKRKRELEAAKSKSKKKRKR